MFDLKEVNKAIKYLYSKGFREAKFSSLKGLNITAENDRGLIRVKIQDGKITCKEESKGFKELK